MRCSLVLLVAVGMATANPLHKKSMNAKAIESVDQSLDALRSHDSAAARSVDRAKKDVTFCVEVRQDNKPVVVDCSNRQPVYVPQSPSGVSPSGSSAAAPEPLPDSQQEPQQQPLVQPIVQPIIQPIVQPFVQPIVQPMQPIQPMQPMQPIQPSQPSQPNQPNQPHAHTLNIEVPCEPEMAAYVVQLPEQLVYAPTGNCIPQVPSVVQVPGATAGAPAQSYNLPGSSHHAHHGIHALSNLHGGHGLHHGIKPLHTQVVPAAHHGLHHLNAGVQCTCQSAPGLVATGKSAEPAPAMDNLALARKFLQDVQRNAAANSAQLMLMPGSAPAGQVQAQYMPMQPMANMQPQISYRHPGMGPVQMMYNPAAMRMKALEDSFTGNHMIPAIRTCRDDGEEAAASAAAAAAPQEAKLADNQEEAKKLSTSFKEDVKNPRVARFTMEKDEAENRLEDN